MILIENSQKHLIDSEETLRVIFCHSIMPGYKRRFIFIEKVVDNLQNLSLIKDIHYIR